MVASNSDQQQEVINLLQKQVALLERLNKGSKQQQQQSRSDFASLRLLIAWLLFLAMYLYPSIASLIKDPIGTLTGTTGATDPIYSREIQEGDTIDGYPVTSGYGPRIAPTGGASSDHKGVDIGTPTGTQLKMLGTGKGKVDCITQAGGAGLYATITPQGIPYEFRAMHLSKCQSGDYEPGQVFALTGGDTGTETDGVSTGAHLHFEMLKDGQQVHPTEGFAWWLLTGEPPKPLGVATAKTGFGDATDKLFSAIVQQESGGNASAINSDTGAIGIGQVMPENVAAWTQQCLGSSMSADQFAGNASAQKQVVNCKLKEYWEAAKARGEGDFDACRSVGAQWYSGDPSLKDSDAPQAGYPSIKAYTESVCSGFGSKQ